MLSCCTLKHNYSSSELLDYISKIESNSKFPLCDGYHINVILTTMTAFGMWSDKLVSMGMVLYIQGSYFNHSCTPNCGTRTMEGQAVQFVATSGIAQGEEICIRYIDVNKPASSRRSELQSHYHFKCECPLCEKETSSPESTHHNRKTKGRTKYTHHQTKTREVKTKK